MKKRIIASLLGLAMMATPVVAFAQTVHVPNDVVFAGASSLAQLVEIHNGQAYFGLRRVAEAYGADVAWNQANHTITLSINGAYVAERFSRDAGIDITPIVRPGTFSVELHQIDGALFVANGPAAGTRLVSSFINDRHYIPAGIFSGNLPNVALALYGQANLNTNLIEMALTTLTGRAATYSLAEGGISITLGDEVTLPSGTFLPPTTAVTLPAELPAQEPVAPTAPSGRFTPGTFTGSSNSTYSHNPSNDGGLTPTTLVVELTVDSNNITALNIVSHGETQAFVNMTNAMQQAIVANNGTVGIDATVNATYTANAIIEAVNAAIAVAEGGSAAAPTQPAETEAPATSGGNDILDVLAFYTDLLEMQVAVSTALLSVTDLGSLVVAMEASTEISNLIMSTDYSSIASMRIKANGLADIAARFNINIDAFRHLL